MVILILVRFFSLVSSSIVFMVCIVYFALFQIRDIESRAMFSKYLREAKPVVRNLFVKYAVSHSTELLYELLYEMDSAHEVIHS